MLLGNLCKECGKQHMIFLFGPNPSGVLNPFHTDLCSVMEVGQNQFNSGLSKLKAGLKPLSEVVSTQLLIWNKNGSVGQTS